MIGRASLSGAPDVVFFNAARQHLYVAVGKPGVIDVVDTTRLEVTESVKTEAGAHTLAFDEARNKVYAFCPGSHSAMVFADE